MSARAVAVIRPAPNIIARLAFLYILSGQGRPVARFLVLIVQKDNILSTWMNRDLMIS
jgi:hypothetical protein